MCFFHQFYYAEMAGNLELFQFPQSEAYIGLQAVQKVNFSSKKETNNRFIQISNIPSRYWKPCVLHVHYLLTCTQFLNGDLDSKTDWIMDTVLPMKSPSYGNDYLQSSPNFVILLLPGKYGLRERLVT